MERREFVKTAVATAMSVSGVFTAGCTGDNTTVDRRDTEILVSPDATDERLSREEFISFADETVDIYGNHGVWGRHRKTPDHGLEYVGAWTDGYDLQAGQGRGDSAVAVYRTRRDIDGDDSYFFWLWNGVLSEIPEGTEGGVTRLYSGVDLPEGYEMGMYSPAGDLENSYTVDVDLFDIEDPSVAIDLNDGEVSPVAEETRVGDAGSYRVDWEGEAEVQSVNAAFEARWDSDAEYRFTWVNGHEATVPLE